MGVVHKAEDPMTTHLNGTEGRGSQENFRARRRAFRAALRGTCSGSDSLRWRRPAQALRSRRGCLTPKVRLLVSATWLT
jgi:hypothetical protein